MLVLCSYHRDLFFWYSTKEEKPTQSSWQGWNTLLTTQPTWWEQATTPIFCSAAVGHLLNFHSLHTICLLLIIYQLYNYSNFFYLIQIVAVINIATQSICILHCLRHFLVNSMWNEANVIAVPPLDRSRVLAVAFLHNTSEGKWGMEFIWITHLQRTTVTVGERRHPSLASGCPASGVWEGDLTLPRCEHST